MAIGTVKWFSATKGYGFVQPEDGSKDVFLHISDVQRAGLPEPREGDRVEYKIQQDKRNRERASDAEIAEAEHVAAEFDKHLAGAIPDFRERVAAIHARLDAIIDRK